MPHTYPELAGANCSWVTDTIHECRQAIEEKSKRNAGSAVEEGGDVIREGIISLLGHHSLYDLHWLSTSLEKEFGIRAFQIYIHRDTAQQQARDDGDYDVDQHAHMIFDWTDKETGEICRLNKEDMVKMQTVVADCLLMDHGEEKKTEGVELFMVTAGWPTITIEEFIKGILAHRPGLVKKLQERVDLESAGDKGFPYHPFLGLVDPDA